MTKKYYSRDQQRSRKRSTSRSRKKDTKVVEDDVTVDTEDDSVFDSILSTCCCASPGSGQNSILDKDDNKEANKNVEDEQPKLWERVSDMALFLVGAAPPVKFVKCLEDGSVDDSTLTNPRVLNELAHEYDMNNKWKVAQSMQNWGHHGNNDDGLQHPIDVDQVSMSTSDEYHNSTRLRPLGGGLTHRRSGSSGSRWGGALKLVRTNSSSKSKSRSAYTDSQLSKAKRAYGNERYPVSIGPNHDYPDEMTRTTSGRSMTRTSSGRSARKSYRPPSSPRRQTASAPSICGTQGGYPSSASYCNRSTSSGKQKKTSRLRRSIRVEI